MASRSFSAFWTKSERDSTPKCHLQERIGGIKHLRVRGRQSRQWSVCACMLPLLLKSSENHSRARHLLQPVTRLSVRTVPMLFWPNLGVHRSLRRKEVACEGGLLLVKVSLSRVFVVSLDKGGEMSSHPPTPDDAPAGRPKSLGRQVAICLKFYLPPPLRHVNTT